jgi:hypothetical protein
MLTTKPKRIRIEALERCIHGNQAFRCTKCGYRRERCQHDKIRSKCKNCKAQRDKAKKTTANNEPKRHPRCEHGRIKYSCTQCKWHTQDCAHGVARNVCDKCKRRPRRRVPKITPDVEPADFSDIWQDAAPGDVNEIEEDCLLLDNE